MSDVQPENGQRHWRHLGVGIFFFALVVRLFYLMESSASPAFGTPIFDSFNYDQAARMLVEDRQIPNLLFWHPVFYTLFLSSVYRVLHSSIAAAKIVQALLGAATCLLTWRLGQRIFDRPTALLAAVGTALYGPLIYFEAELVATGWEAFWSVVLMLLFLRARDAGNPWQCFEVGLCGALSVLTRPNFIPFFLAASVWLAVALYQRGNRGRRLASRMAVLGAGFLLPALPAAAANLRVTGRLTILPSNGGINLYMGNNPNSAETEAIRPWGEYSRLRSLAAHAGARHVWEENRFFYSRVVDYVLTSPLDFCRGLGRKAVQFLNSREIPSYEDVYLAGRWSRLLRLLTWKAGPFGFPFGVLLPLAIIGLVCCRQRVPTPLLLFVILYPASVVLVHVMGRYRVPLIPSLSILAAAGCLAVIGLLRQRQRYRSLVVVGGVSAVALTATLPGPFLSERKNTEAELYLGLAICRMQRGETEAAAYHAARALSLQPDWPDAQYQLALAFHGQRKLDQAVACYTRVLELDPEYLEAHAGLADVLLEKGRIEDAVLHFREALRINPGDVNATVGLGLALVAQGNTGQGIDQYRQVLQIEPGNFRAHYNFGVALVKLGRIDDAVAQFRLALRTEPGNYRAHYQLGAALARQGRTEEAMAEYREALRINPDFPPAREALESVLLRKDPS